MPHIAFLTRIRRLFTTPNPHFNVIADAFAKGRLRQPAQPMSDRELARAIREFQTLPLSDAALKQLGTRFAESKAQY